MSRFFKSAAFPILIVIVLAFFASKLIQSGDQAQAASYSQFLTQIDARPGRHVVLQTKDNSAEVTLKGAGPEALRRSAGSRATAAALINKLRAAETEGKINGLRRQAGALAA